MSTVPTVPVLPAGYVVQAADLNNLVTVASFLLAKPYAHVTDQTGGFTMPGSGDGQVDLNGVTSALMNNGTSGCIDTDGMGASTEGGGNALTIQTIGWYRCRYCIRALQSSTGAVLQGYLVFQPGSSNPLLSAYPSGVALYQSQAVFNATTSAGACAGGGMSPFPLYPGDQVQLYGATDSGAASTAVVASSGDNSFIEAEWVSSV